MSRGSESTGGTLYAHRDAVRSVPGPVRRFVSLYLRVKRRLAPWWHRMPDSRVRRWLVAVKTRSHAWTRPGTRWVPVESLYHGASLLFSSREVGALLGDPDWHLTRLVDGAQVDLYRRFANGEDVPRPGERLEDVPYVIWARKQIEAGLTCMGRDSVDQIPGIVAERRKRWEADVAAGATTATPGDVPAVGLPVVRRIRGTGDHEIADGDHRIARAWVRGQRWVQVRVTWRTVPAVAEDRTGV